MLVDTKQKELPFIGLECGEFITPITIAYETYGNLNKEGSNAILICHALTGDAHAAGKFNEEDSKFGWWDKFIGPNKAIDTNKYFVISSNVVGGCAGSTGPSSLNQKTKKPYGLKFPFITIKDMVKAQELLIQSLGIKKLLSCIGGSMGGMQVLEWAITYPDKCQSFIPLATAAYQSPQNIALHEVGRRAIMNDPNWKGGKYYDTKPPNDGLSVARMIAHISYLSDVTMHQKFGRRIRKKDELNFELHNEFEVESYLEYQGRSFINRFDANSYLYITRAVDYFDYGDKKLREVLSQNSSLKNSKFLLVSFSSDWLYPSYQSIEIVKALQFCNIPVTYCEIDSPYGHDAFLLEDQELAPLIKGFLKNL
ncbi:MAG: homoserine O-acetyltransferase [Candidatus Caenarcaniphilales bacterium]|nr:homoserine O-acetyltransferase [Candidatus Caenarcaniphilales bacterium]